MATSVCTPFTYKNFIVDNISDVVLNPSLWEKMQLHSNRIKVDLEHCDIKSASSACSRVITATVFQNFPPLERSLAHKDIISSNGYKITKDNFEQFSSELFSRVKKIETSCIPQVLDGEKYVKDLATLELDNISGLQRIQDLQTIGLAALALVTSSLIILGLYKLYKRCTQVKVEKTQERELYIQFRPKSSPVKGKYKPEWR
ncbi:MAG TPA: hypothetical protein VGP47_00830 [Parachlamydiaceae bacterium]|nr:hypothetical protein [Parachlamydiaceae bacterium]